MRNKYVYPEVGERVFMWSHDNALASHGVIKSMGNDHEHDYNNMVVFVEEAPLFNPRTTVYMHHKYAISHGKIIPQQEVGRMIHFKQSGSTPYEGTK